MGLVHSIRRDGSQKQELVNEMVPTLGARTPGSGKYLNEANFRHKDWQREFRGEKYARLLAIKEAYYPGGLLYAVMAVGSEAWVIDEQGCICHVAKQGF
jgi:hypothetical protein